MRSDFYYILIALGLFVIFVSSFYQSQQKIGAEHLSIQVEIPKALENANKTLLQGSAFLAEQKLIDPYIIYVKRQPKWSHVFFILQNPFYRDSIQVSENETVKVLHHSMQSKRMFQKVLTLMQSSPHHLTNPSQNFQNTKKSLKDFHFEHVIVDKDAQKDTKEKWVSAFNEPRPTLFTCFLQPFYFQPRYLKQNNISNEEDTQSEKNEKQMLQLKNAMDDMDFLLLDYVKEIGDLSKIPFLFPYAKIETVHMAELFREKDKKELEYIYPLISYDHLLYSEASFGDVSHANKTQKEVWHHLQRYYQILSEDPASDAAALFFYEKHGHRVLTDAAYFYFGDQIKGKYAEQQIDPVQFHSVEGFTNSITSSEKIERNVILTPQQPLQLHLSRNPEQPSFRPPFVFKRFLLKDLFVDRVRVKPGDTLRLTRQEQPVENGVYKVVEVNSDDYKSDGTVILQTGLYLPWDDLFITVLNIDHIEKWFYVSIKEDHPDITDNMVESLIELGLPIFIETTENDKDDRLFLSGYIEKIDDEKRTFYALVRERDAFSHIQNSYECYGFDKIKTREACEDPESFEMQLENNELSLPSENNDDTSMLKRRGYWDRRCVTDMECPFFEKNGKGYRGGCTSGYCEMPVGIDQLAFRRYRGVPFCKGCDNVEPEAMSACCEKKKTEKKSDVYYFRSL